MLNRNMSVENVVIAILLVVLVVLVVYYVKKNNEGFESNNKPKLYFFYVDWCPHCTKAKENVFNEESWKNVENSDRVELVKINCEGSDEEKALAKKNNVQAFPTVILEKDGESHELEEGVSPSSVSDLISRY